MAENSYPLDIQSLKKGQSFTISELEDLLGVRLSDMAKFRFAVLGLQAQIQELRGFTVKANDEGLFILTDSDAVVHNEKLARQYRRGLRTRFDLAAEIDIANLTPEEILAHDRAMLRNGRILQAITQEIRTMQLEGLLDGDAVPPALPPGDEQDDATGPPEE